MRYELYEHGENMSKEPTCKYGVPQSEVCEDDVCYDCEFLKQIGKDIYCTYKPEKSVAEQVKEEILDFETLEDLVKCSLEHGSIDRSPMTIKQFAKELWHDMEYHRELDKIEEIT